MALGGDAKQARNPKHQFVLANFSEISMMWKIVWVFLE